MNARLLVAALVVVGLPMIAIASAQDTPDPGLPDVGEVPDPGEDAAFDEVFVVLDENACPIEDGFEADLLEGTTAWSSEHHPRASQDCVAQWGDGTYERGSKAALEATEMPTRHLAASNAPSQLVNDAAQTLIDNGVDPRIAAPVLAGFADGCEAAYAVGDTTAESAMNPAGDFCREVIQGSTMFLEVPEVPSGVGALYLDVSHAYQFSQPDDNQIAPDGAWVEARVPGEDYQRLDPVALYGPSEDGQGTLCGTSGPVTVILDNYIRNYDGGAIEESISSLEELYRPELPPEMADATPSILDPIPESEHEWRENCGGIVDQTYDQTLQTSQDTGEDETSSSSNQPPLQRISPYPGTIRGEGSGFVGSTVDETGEPRFIKHWFDLSPYAGETVEVRFLATGGAGLGTQEGGWWIDHANLRYSGPADDLSVRVDTPQDGDVLPSGRSQITPGGVLPVEFVVENLGRTPAGPATVEVSMAGAMQNVTVPELQPLDAYRAFAILPVPTAGDGEISAALAQRVPLEENAQNVPYADSFPANNEDTIEVSFDAVQDVELDIVEVQQDGSEFNVTVDVENQGNQPAMVPLEATLTPVDLSTRSPRTVDAQPQGIVASVMVPHSDEVNSYGVSDPTRSANVDLEVPNEGVWEIKLSSIAHDDADATTIVPFGEATPTAISNSLGRVLTGPTEEIPRGGFELVGETDDLDEQAAFLEDLRHPIDGPETRFVPIGQAAMGSAGEMLPEEWSPVRGENAAAWGNASIGGEDRDSCEVDAELADNTNIGGQVLNQQLGTVAGSLETVLCTANDLNETVGGACDQLRGQNETVGDACASTLPTDSIPEDLFGDLENEAGIRSPTDLRVPASLQAWNVRQNHVAIYGVGTDASDAESLDASDEESLRIQEDDDRVYIDFRHAGKLHWENERGAKAQLAIVPGGQVNLVEEMRSVENQTRQLTHDLGLPPEGQALVNTLLMDVFFQNVIQNTPDTRLPQDVCNGLNPGEDDGGDDGVGLVTQTLLTFCGDTQVVENVEPACDQADIVAAECDLTEHVDSTILHQSGQTEEDGVVVEWTQPVGWQTERVDITRIVEETTREDGLDEGFYVMFNLVTTSDLDTFLTSASADAPGEGDKAGAQTADTDAALTKAEATFGWERGTVPVWTVNEPRLERAAEDSDEPRARWCLSPNPDTEDISECETEKTLQPSDMRGWETFWLEDSARTAWSYEQRGGDPQSTSPGALVWEGGSGELIQTHDGLSVAIDQDERDPYSVLKSPVVDVSGYDQPVAQMNVQWGQSEAGTAYYGDDQELASLESRCDSESDAAQDSHVWAWTGWNVRVRPVNADGSLGEAQTVEPVGGYHACETDTDARVSVLFNGEAIYRSPNTYESTIVWEGSPVGVPGSDLGSTCGTGLEEATDPTQFCRDAELAFGHEEPVFAFPMPGWNEVAFDLSEFRGQQVQIEVHAFGLMAEEPGSLPRDPVPRGELRVDAFEVSEGNPPYDASLDHEDRSLIAPATEERFELDITNRGSDPIDRVDLRRTVVGPDGCQAVDPVVEPWTLLDPQTGEPGLPPGEEATIRNPQLAWNVPDDEGEIYERRLTVETGGSLAPSLAPEAILHPGEDGSVTAVFVDGDDCADDVELTVDELAGDANVDEDANTVTVDHEDEEDIETRSSIKVHATDAHGVESLPAYLTPVPPTGLQDPVPGFEATCDPLPDDPNHVAECTFDASELTQDPSDVIEEYRWDFDDADEGAGENVTHRYEDAGTYNVELTVAWDIDEDEEETASVDEWVTVNEDDPYQQLVRTVVEGTNIQGLLGLSDDEDDELEQLPDEGETEVEVLQSATREDGTGSAVRIAVDKPEDSMATRLVLPCETGAQCEGNMIGVTGFDDVLLQGLAPGHYIGYVMFGDQFAFSPVEFTVELEPDTGTDARPSDNTITLKSEIREDPSVRVESIDVPKLLPVGEEVQLDIQVTNDGNVPLEDVTTDVRISPFDLSVEADRIQRLDPGRTLTAQATVDLPRPGPATVSVATTAAAEDRGTVADEKGSGTVVVDRHVLSPEPGDHDHWDVDEVIQFGDGNRLPSNVNTTLPLAGQMDTASSPFSIFEINVSGTLEQAYDGLSVEWRPADAELNAQSRVPYKDLIRTEGYRVPGSNLQALFDEDADRDRLGIDCDPFIDTSDIANQEVPIAELSNPETYACHELPLGSNITASHKGGTPGNLTSAITGTPTLDLPGIETQQIRTSAADIPSTQRTVDTISASDWEEKDQMGGFTFEEDRSSLDSSSAFYLPTGTIAENAEHYSHELRVPLTVGEWCQLTTEMVPDRTPFRIVTEERRLFANQEAGTSGWDVNVRFETGDVGLATSTVIGDTIVDLEDPTTTGWESLEYDLPLGPLFAVATEDPVPIPGSLSGTDEDNCQVLEEEAADQKDRLSEAEIILELTSEQGPNEDALDVGWFVGSLEAPELGIDIGASESNHEARTCQEQAPPETWPPGNGQGYRTVYGCSEFATSGEPKRGSLEPGDEWVSDPLGSTERIQSIAFSGSTVVNDASENVVLLEALRSERPLEIDEPTENGLYSDLDDDETPEVLTTHPSGYEFGEFGDTDGEDWFRYVDAVALVDLRAGLDGEVLFDMHAENGDDIVAQVVAAPLEPGEAFGEEAPTRVEWTPLQVCEADAVSLTYPPTPLGAGPGEIVGPLDAYNTTLEDVEYTSEDDKQPLCADVSPVGGEVALIGIRLWMPTQDASVEIGDAEVNMDVPDPQQLRPQLRAMTDDTVHEGTLTIHDVSILSMPPAFSHNADVAFDEPVKWKGDEVLESNSTPSFTIHVDQPARQSTWDIQANVSFDVTVSSDANTDVESGTYAGFVDLPQSSYEGSQKLDVTWEMMRESVESYQHTNGTWDDEVDYLDWLADEPVLPSGDIAVDAIDVRVETELDALVDPVSDCPSSLEDLAKSTDVTCRQLATIVDEGRQATTSIDTERALPDDPGVRHVAVTPDRDSPVAVRTAHLELTNPSSLPVSLSGTLTLSSPGGALLEEIPFPERTLEAWSDDTATMELPPVDGEHDRIVVEATIEDTNARDDYRRTTLHEASNMVPFFFNDEASGVTQTLEAAKPDLPGASGDGVGWMIESGGGDRDITPLATDSLDAQGLYDMLQEDEDPLLVFQHQRDLVGDASEDSDGDYSYLGAALCSGFENSEPDEEDPCVLLESAWAPDPADAMASSTETDPNTGESWDECTEEGQDEPDPNLVAYGINGPGHGVLGDSTGVIRPSVLGAWETAAFEIPESAVDTVAPSGDWPVHFRIFLGECSTEKPSTVVVDDVGLASARPVLDIGAQDVPIWPGSEKRYPFTLENRGAGSDIFRVVPSQEVPDGWHVSIDVDGDTVYDTRTGQARPVEVAQDETLEGVARVQAPSDARGTIQDLALTAYATNAPGLMSSGALKASIERVSPSQLEEDPLAVADPGAITLRTERVELPNLVVQDDSITVENAEIGRETNIQFQVANEGLQRAEDVPIAVAMRGPSGFETLASPSGEDPVRETVQPGATTTLTYTWTPREAGEHTLRIVADPDPGDVNLLLDDEVERFFGVAQESAECSPREACPNLLDHAFQVEPLQQPDLRLDVQGVPERIGIGDETELTVIVENVGGRAATDATLRLSENGLLPILDSMTVDLPRIEPGGQETITTTWAPVSPGEGLVIGSVEGPDVYTGQRPDGSSASEDSDVALPVVIDRPDVDASLSEPIRTEPGTSHAVLLNVTNDGTAPVEILPETVHRDGVYLSPVVNAPVEVPPGQWETVPVLGFAEIGTPPTTRELPVPLSQGDATATVTVLGAADARVVLDETPLEPGTADLQALVTNHGNVPLDGEIRVRGDGIRGTASVDIAPGDAANVTVPVTVQPRVEPGTVNVATHVTTDDEDRVTQIDRLTVDAAPAVDFDLRADEVPLTGSAQGQLVIRNVGNMPLDGRAVLDGPVSLSGSPMLDLDPAASTVLPVTWVSGTDRNGTASVETLDGDTVGTTQLSPSDVSPRLEVSNVGTSPSVNLAEGMIVQVVGTVENTGVVPLENHTLGVTVDGELYQTFEIDDVRPGEVTTASHELELPKSGEITLGLVDLAAFQRGETAGAATTITADEASLGLGTMLEIPNLPVLGVVSIVGVAAGVKRR